MRFSNRWSLLLHGVAMVVAMSSCGGPRPKSYGTYLIDRGRLVEIPRYAPASDSWADFDWNMRAGKVSHPLFTTGTLWPMREGFPGPGPVVPNASPPARLLVYLQGIQAGSVQMFRAHIEPLVANFTTQGIPGGSNIRVPLPGWPLGSVQREWRAILLDHPDQPPTTTTARGWLGRELLVVEKDAKPVELTAAPVRGLPDGYQLAPNGVLEAGYYAVLLNEPGAQQSTGGRTLGFFAVGSPAEVQALRMSSLKATQSELNADGFGLAWTSDVEGEGYVLSYPSESRRRLDQAREQRAQQSAQAVREKAASARQQMLASAPNWIVGKWTDTFDDAYEFRGDGTMNIETLKRSNGTTLQNVGARWQVVGENLVVRTVAGEELRFRILAIDPAKCQFMDADQNPPWYYTAQRR